MEGLSIICAGLGFVEEDENGNRISYTKAEYCLDNLKDLLRFLRRDDPQTREVFNQVCKWNTVGKDLIPIIEHCQDDRNLVLNTVKVLVFLTMPIEAASNDISQQIEHLWGLKSSITCSDTVAVIVSLLENALENLECEAFSEDDWKLVQLVLTLFRNILAVQDISLRQKAGGSATQFLSMRDRFLELLFRENVMDLILVLTQHVGGSCGYLRKDNLLLLETFHYIFMGQEPELIAKAYLKESKVDGDAKASLNSLISIMEEEEERRKLTKLANLGCYSQLSGTFTRLTMDGSKTLFKGNPCSASCDTLLKRHKVPRGPLKRTAWDHGRLPSTKDNILELLHDFVNQFLSGGYNVLMQSIREDIESEHHAIQNSDVVVFFQVAQFVASFQYHKLLISKPNTEANTSEAFVNKYADSTLFKGDICGPIAASMNESMFLLVILKWRNAFDGLKETNDYKFLSAAGSLVKIMIRMLDLVLKLSPEDSKEPQTARILLYKLFYDQTDQGMTQFLLNLIKSFDTHKQPKSDLADLVEMIHVIVRLMENLQARGTLRVSRKSRKGRKKKTLTDKDIVDEPFGEHDTVNNEIGISGCEESVNLSMPRKKSLFATSDEKEDVFVPVQVDEPNKSELERGNLGGNPLQVDDKMSHHVKEDHYFGTDDSSSDEQLAVTDEVDFKLSTLVSAFASNTIIQNLCWLLKFYKSNSPRTNHYLICMLRRICEDLELSPMLYQVSLLTTFYNILVEQKSCPCKEYENIVYFLTSLVRKMLRKMKSQSLLFVEVLFWKTRKECHYINAESLLHELGDLRKESRTWGIISEKGEIGSSQCLGGIRRSIADALGDDEADFVISHELDNQRDEDPYEAKVHNVLHTTNESGGETDEKENSDNRGNSMIHESERVSKRKKRLILNDEQEKKIKDLYEKYKDNRHCSRLIAEALDPNGKVSPVQVSTKLKKLGFKVTTKKRMLHADVPFADDPDQCVVESSLLGRPLHTRKRVRAFSENQEMMIKALFEQFKDHTKCSYMIANALATDGTFTAAQVSRKLKQLGLRVPSQKRSEVNLHLRDENLNDFFTDGAQYSDNETLISLKKRKTRRLHPKAKDEELKTSSLQQIVTENSSGNGVTQDVMERDGPEQPSEVDAAEIEEDVAFNHDELDGNSEAEVTGISTGKQLGVAPINNLDHLPHQQVADELADSGDDVAPGASPKTTVIRRKLRMVIDLEDDE